MKTAHMHRLSLFIIIWLIYTLIRFFGMFTVNGHIYQPKIGFSYNGVWLLASILICLILHSFTFILYLVAAISRCCSNDSTGETPSLQFNEIPEPKKKPTFGKTMKELAFTVLKNAGISGIVQLFVVTFVFYGRVWYDYSLAKVSDKPDYSPLFDFASCLIMVNMFSGFMFYDWFKMKVRKETPVPDSVSTDLEQN